MVEETTNLPIPVDKDLRSLLDFVIRGDKIYVHMLFKRTHAHECCSEAR